MPDRDITVPITTRADGRTRDSRGAKDQRQRERLRELLAKAQAGYQGPAIPPEQQFIGTQEQYVRAQQAAQPPRGRPPGAGWAPTQPGFYEEPEKPPFIGGPFEPYERFAKKAVETVVPPATRALQLGWRPFQVGGELIASATGEPEKAKEVDRIISDIVTGKRSLRSGLGEMVSRFEQRPEAEQTVMTLPFIVPSEATAALGRLPGQVARGAKAAPQITREFLAGEAGAVRPFTTGRGGVRPRVPPTKPVVPAAPTIPGEAGGLGGEEILERLAQNLALNQQNKQLAYQHLRQNVRPAFEAKFGDFPVMTFRRRGDEQLLAISTAGWKQRAESLGLEFVETSGFDDLYRVPQRAIPGEAGGVVPGAGRAGIPPQVPPAAAAVPETPGFAANIRLSKYPEDIRGEILKWAEANPERAQTARRGIVSDAQVRAEAEKLVGEVGGDFAKLQKRWKPGEAWNAEEITAIRGTLRSKTEQVMEAARAARANNTVENQARLLNALQEQGRIQEVVHGVTAESGRALRAFRQEAFDAIQAGQSRKVEQILERVGADRSKLDEIAEALTKIDIDDPMQVNQFIREMSKPSKWDYVLWYYYNAILSSPKTHIVNEIGNTSMMVAAPAEHGLAAGIEQVLARIQRRPIERFFSEVPAEVIGQVQGMKEGVRAALQVMKTGVSRAQATKWEVRFTGPKGPVGAIFGAPTRALEAADTFHFTTNYRAQLYALSVRQAKGAGLKGSSLSERVAELIANPTEDLVRQASQKAEAMLFRAEPKEYVKVLTRLRDLRIPHTPIQPLRFVAPFIRTPAQLVESGLARSPLALLNPRLYRALASKSPEASDILGRAALGSAIMTVLGLHFADGRITGRAPKNKAERDRFYREGKQPYAIKIGDTWIQYRRIEPWNQPLTLLAAIVDAINDKRSEKDVFGMAGEAAMAMANNLVSQTYLSGLSSLLGAIQEPERYAERFFGMIPTAFVPFSSALRTAAQMIDPTVRRPETLIERLKAGIPGLSRQVPPAITAFGEEAPRVSPAWSPVVVSKAKQGEVDAELERIGVEVGFVGETIGGVDLTREQQMEYQRQAGQETYQNLVKLMASSRYRGAQDEQKQTMIERIVSASRERVRAQLRGGRQSRLRELLQKAAGATP